MTPALPVRGGAARGRHAWGALRRAADLHGLFEMSAHPDDLLKVDVFMAGVGLPGDDSYGIPDLLRNYAGDNSPIACMAMEALSRRPSDPSCVAGAVRWRGSGCGESRVLGPSAGASVMIMSVEN